MAGLPMKRYLIKCTCKMLNEILGSCSIFEQKTIEWDDKCASVKKSALSCLVPSGKSSSKNALKREFIEKVTTSIERLQQKEREADRDRQTERKKRTIAWMLKPTIGAQNLWQMPNEGNVTQVNLETERDRERQRETERETVQGIGQMEESIERGEQKERRLREWTA